MISNKISAMARIKKRKEYSKIVYFLRWMVEWPFTVFFLFWFFLILFWPAKLVTSRRKERGEKPRIIWGPTPILTISVSSRAEKRLGYQSNTLVYQPYYITDNFDYNLEKYHKILWLRPLIPWLVFTWAMLKYDVFHYFFGRGFLMPHRGKRINRIELPILKLAGKVVVVSAYGGDVRYEKKCRSEGKYNCCIDCNQKMIACICDEKLAISNVNYVNRYVDIALSMGDMVEYTPGSKNDVFYWPIDLDEVKYVGVREQNDPPIIIIHASNHRQFKGTKYLISAVENLRNEGYPIELQLIEGVSNARARELYRNADIVAEQFIIGWHGYFAVEAMALGKPVVCYIRKPKEYLPKDKECPIINADPDNLEDRLKWLIENPQIRAELGKKGRAYVEEVFALDRVGERLDTIYQTLWRKPVH